MNLKLTLLILSAIVIGEVGMMIWIENQDYAGLVLCSIAVIMAPLIATFGVKQ